MFNVVLEVVFRTLTLLSRSVKDLDVFELDADACPQTQWISCIVFTATLYWTIRMSPKEITCSFLINKYNNNCDVQMYKYI